MKFWHGWYKIEDCYGWDTWEWVHETMGGPSECGRWFYNAGSDHNGPTGYYYFKQAKDAMLFMLARAGTEIHEILD